MPLRVSRPDDVAGSRPPGVFECALINNMPDAAFLHTEQQFLRLLGPAARRATVRVRRYRLPGVPRSAPPVDAGYLPLDDLWDRAPDAVIVTGSEPVAARLTDEPYWEEFTHLLDWSMARARTVLLSCLAAHGGLLHLDGLPRRRLDRKRTGTFAQRIASDHPLTAGLPLRTMLPHSRYNDVAAADVSAAGWDILMWSDTAGWSVATTERSGCRLVVVQGHPEYDADTLLREFRRDLARYQQGDTEEFPEMPASYLGQKAAAALTEYLTAGGARRGADPAGFPFDRLARHLRSPWRQPALRLFENWAALAIGGRPSEARRSPEPVSPG